MLNGTGDTEPKAQLPRSDVASKAQCLALLPLPVLQAVLIGVAARPPAKLTAIAMWQGAYNVLSSKTLRLSFTTLASLKIWFADCLAPSAGASADVTSEDILFEKRGRSYHKTAAFARASADSALCAHLSPKYEALTSLQRAVWAALDTKESASPATPAAEVGSD